MRGPGLRSGVRSPLRPFPSLGGRRRRPRVPPTRVLVGVPRISPERELAAIQALIKPQAGRALAQHIDAGEQHWPADARDRTAAVEAVARDYFDLELTIHLPAAGEYLAVAGVDGGTLPAALAAGLFLSRAFPGTWVVVGRLFARDETFYRRERGVKLNLRPAGDVHLSREMRAAYRQAVRAAT